MKKTIILLAFSIMCIGMSAQKYAFIDSEYIFEQIPAYKKALEQLEVSGKKWSAQIESKQTNIKNLYEAYQKNQQKMSANEKAQKETQIVNAEKELQQLGDSYFGSNGEMEKLQDKLLTPYNDKLYEATKQIATREGYGVIWDRATTDGAIFVNPQIDISKQVLQLMK